MLNWPTVSVIVTCYNENACISKCLNSIIANDYDFTKLEIIVVDGLSIDGTREIIQSYCQRYNFIKMLDNPQRLKPAGNNLGIKAACHEYVMIMDGHSAYPPDYIRKIVAGSIKTGSDNYGGIIEVLPQQNTNMGRTLAAINTSPFAVGNAHYRIGTKQIKKVDTVPFGCFKRDLFNQIGLFNPNLPRAEDRDINARIISGGGSIYLDPSIKCQYFIRSRLLDYLRWIQDNGFWVFYADRYTSSKFRSWRNFIPLLFLLYGLTLYPMHFTATRPIFYAWLAPLSLYILLDIFFSARIAIHKIQPFSGFLALLLFPLTHIAYGCGSLRGIIKLQTSNRAAIDADHREADLKQ